MPAAAPKLAVPDLVIPSPTRSAPRVSVKPVTPPPAPAALDGGDGAALAGLDLQIDLGAVTQQQQQHPQKPPNGGASPFDDEDDFAAGPALELDMGGGSLPPALSGSPAAPVPTSVSVPTSPISQSSLSPRASPPPPSGASLAPAENKPAVDPYEAKVLADYGPPPEAFYRTPLYAYRVLMRRGELGRLLLQQRAEATGAAQRAEDELVAFAERLREAIEKTGGRGLEQVLAAEEMLRSRDGALAGAMDGHKAAVAEVDARLGAAEGELARAKQEESRAVALHEAALQDHQRADAKLKRLDIEIRNGDPKARAAERGILAGEAATKEPKVAEAFARLLGVRRGTEATQARVAAIRGERESLEQRFGRQVGTRSEGVEDARKQVRAALAALGRSMLTDATAPELDAARAEVTARDGEASAKAKAVALHEAAVASYDAAKVVIGVALLVGAVVLLIVLLLFPFIYRALVT